MLIYSSSDNSRILLDRLCLTMPDTGQAQEQEEHNPTEATLPYHQGSPPEQLEEPQPEVQADDTGAQV